MLKVEDKRELLKQQTFLPHAVSEGQKSRSDLAECLWLTVSYDVTLQLLYMLFYLESEIVFFLIRNICMLKMHHNTSNNSSM